MSTESRLRGVAADLRAGVGVAVVVLLVLLVLAR
jgi:hypothetical protein